MKDWVWFQGGDCRKGSIKVDFLPRAHFVYRALEYMFGMDVLPCVRKMEREGEMASDGVIVIGDEEESRYLLAGALTAFRSPTYLRVLRRGGRFSAIEVDQPQIKPEENPEEMIVLEGSDWRELLCRYADMAAQRMGARPIAAEKNTTGYCTWYYYYKDVSGQDLLDNVKALSENRSLYSAEYVQIDDGYQDKQGDWLTPDSKWPFTLESAAAKIKAAGMKPGIWLMPFVVSTASRIYREHPDWVVKNPLSGGPVIQRGWTAGESDWCCLDASIPEVCEHITSVFKEFWKKGYVYFKLDGLFFGMAQGIRRNPKITAAEAFRKLCKAIREAVPEALIMGCGEPFHLCLGYFDNARGSNDASRHFAWPRNNNENSPLNACDIVTAEHMTMANFWRFDRWFRIDPDSLMARQDNAFYSEGEARFSVLTGICTGVCITSDRLDTIAPERLALLGKAQNYRLRNARPIRWRGDQWPQFFEGTVNGKRAIAVFNDSETELVCDFAELGLPERCQEVLTEAVYKKVRKLPVHDAALFMPAE